MGTNKMYLASQSFTVDDGYSPTIISKLGLSHQYDLENTHPGIYQLYRDGEHFNSFVFDNKIIDFLPFDRWIYFVTDKPTTIWSCRNTKFNRNYFSIPWPDRSLKIPYDEDDVKEIIADWNSKNLIDQDRITKRTSGYVEATWEFNPETEEEEPPSDKYISFTIKGREQNNYLSSLYEIERYVMVKNYNTLKWELFNVESTNEDISFTINENYGVEVNVLLGGAYDLQRHPKYDNDVRTAIILMIVRSNYIIYNDVERKRICNYQPLTMNHIKITEEDNGRHTTNLSCRPLNGKYTFLSGIEGWEFSTLTNYGHQAVIWLRHPQSDRVRAFMVGDGDIQTMKYEDVVVNDDGVMRPLELNYNSYMLGIANAGRRFGSVGILTPYSMKLYALEDFYIINPDPTLLSDNPLLYNLGKDAPLGAVPRNTSYQGGHFLLDIEGNKLSMRHDFGEPSYSADNAFTLRINGEIVDSSDIIYITDNEEKELSIEANRTMTDVEVVMNLPVMLETGRSRIRKQMMVRGDTYTTTVRGKDMHHGAPYQLASSWTMNRFLEQLYLKIVGNVW